MEKIKKCLDKLGFSYEIGDREALIEFCKLHDKKLTKKRENQ